MTRGRRRGTMRAGSHPIARQITRPRTSMKRVLRALLTVASIGLAMPVLAVPARTTALVALAAPTEQECSRSSEPPPPVPGDPSTASFWGRYRVPLPPAAVYNAPGPKRVGLQAGHWRTYDIPAELRGLGPGTSAG